MQMEAISSLDDSIQAPVSIDTKCEILRHLWDVTVTPSKFYDGSLDYDAYFSYYSEQCSDALHDGGRHIFVRTHIDIVQIARHLKSSMSRDSIKNNLRSKPPAVPPLNEDKLLDGSIDLVARLLLMVEFGCLQYGFTGRKQLHWESVPLGKCINQFFGASRAMGHESVKLEKRFNARNLGRIAGIEIEWTNNLADHLSLIDDDKKVAIFHHASFLECQLNNTIFPSGLVSETIRTLALLFPGTDPSIKKWYKKLSARNNLDNKAVKCGRLRTEDRRIENFEFWHDRLVILKQHFDEAEPGTVSQWWCDRRKRVQWYTFWIAALVLGLTVFFGVVQSVEGALQVYKAYNPS